MQIRQSGVILLAVLLALAACGDSKNKIGSTVKGDRVAVMEQAKSLEADKDLGAFKPQLPSMNVNLSWPQAGYDSEHVLPYAEVAAVPHLRWKSSIGEGSDSDYKILSHPVLSDGKVFAMDSRGLVRAFDAKSGEKLWSLDTTPKSSDDQAISGGVAVDGGIVYVASGFGEVFALNAKTGAVKWRKALLKPLRSAPTIGDNRVYVVSIDNELNALNADDGAVLWHHSGITESATLMGAASPALDGDTVVVAYNSGEIFALRAQNGRASWNYTLSNATQVGALPAIADIRGLPVVDHGVIYAISHSGRMAAIAERSGDKLWESDIGGIDTPVIAGNTIFLFGGDNQLIALAKDSGRPVWVKSLPKREDPKDKDSDRIVWTGPVLAGERLWMVNSQGRLASFSPTDGAPLDSIDVGVPLYVSPIVADHVFYLVTDDGDLVALR